MNMQVEANTEGAKRYMSVIQGMLDKGFQVSGPLIQMAKEAEDAFMALYVDRCQAGMEAEGQEPLNASILLKEFRETVLEPQLIPVISK